MRIAIFQAAAGGDVAARLERLGEVARVPGRDLVVAPELFLPGYDTGAALAAHAEPEGGGPLLAGLARIARETGTALVAGHPERQGDLLHNVASCLDRQGRRIARHAKTVLPPGFERRRFAEGAAGFPVFDLGGLRCALLICYEVEFPEAVRGVAAAGADLLIVPTALEAGWEIVPRAMVPVRALESGLWIAYANHAGAEGDTSYAGESAILRPDGTEAARAGRAEAVIEARLAPVPRAERSGGMPYADDLPGLRRRLFGR